MKRYTLVFALLALLIGFGIGRATAGSTTVAVSEAGSIETPVETPAEEPVEVPTEGLALNESDIDEAQPDEVAVETTTIPTTTIPTTTQPQLVPDVTSELTWGFDATVPSAAWTKPELFEATTDPAYGTEIRRLTSAEGTRFDRNTYSRRQAENANGELFMTYHGNAEYRVTSRLTGELVATLPFHPDAEPQWHPTDPDRIRHLAGDDFSTGELNWYEYDLETGTSTRIADLLSRITEELPNALYLSDAAEGSPSADGNRVAWMVYNAAEDPIAIVAYDVATDTILGIKSDLRFDLGEPDWVSMSASGEYVVAGHLQGTFAYDAEGLGNERQLNTKAEHSDIGFDANGRDVYVAIDFSTGPDAGWLTSIDLATGEVTRVFEVYGGANTSVHVSAKGYDRPGWVVVSTYNCKDDGAWTCHKVLAVEIATGRTLHLAHTYNCGASYWTETHAVVNQSFTRVYFNSDGGSCGIDAEVYELTLPDFN